MDLSRITRFLRPSYGRLVLTAILLSGASDALAVVGGCHYNSEYARMLSFATAPEVESYVDAVSATRLAWMKKDRQRVPSGAEAVLTWTQQQRQKMLQDPMACSHGEFPLDYAVANGNLDVVRWLLANSVDPAAKTRSKFSDESIFSRCRHPAASASRPDKLSADEVRERQLAAYRLLIAHGADVNDPDPFYYRTGCHNPAMHAMLKQLGADVTAETFPEWVWGTVGGGGEIRASTWTTLEGLAGGRGFDFRGSALEYRLVQSLHLWKDGLRRDALVDLTEGLSRLVRLSPGIIPGRPATTSDIPGNFHPERSHCYFPEMSAVAHVETIPIVHRRRDRRAAPVNTIDIRVDRPEAPVLLALINLESTPVQWVIHRSPATQILGVMVLTPGLSDQTQADTLSFDPVRPAFFGGVSNCQGSIDSDYHRVTRTETITLTPYQSSFPRSRIDHPLQLDAALSPAVVDGNEYVIGTPAASTAWIAWPESVRRAIASEKK